MGRPKTLLGARAGAPSVGLRIVDGGGGEGRGVNEVSFNYYRHFYVKCTGLNARRVQAEWPTVNERLIRG